MRAPEGGPVSGPTVSGPVSGPIVSGPIVSTPNDAPPEPTGVPAGLDRYERRQLVGVGGMGRVSVAWDRVLHREVALKEPGPGHGPALLEEARRAAALEHPGIVPIFDVGVGPDGAPWYTMRLLRGRPLEEALRAEPDLAGRLGWLRAMLAACEAVAHAHARGVVHRDLTPANLLLGELGETCVADWGLAALSGAHGAGGTPGYRAPEQEAGAPVDARADVYALGAVLFRLCAGAPPRPGVSLPADTPAELVPVIGRATAPDPAARYPDARALAEDLAAFLDGRRVSAYTYSRWELARRLAAAWRAPLAVGAVATFVLLVTASAQYVATVRERDRAQLAERAASANLGQTLSAHAVRALRSGAVGEAAVLAAHALVRSEAAGPSRDAPDGAPAPHGAPSADDPLEWPTRAYARGVLAAAAAAAAPEVIATTPLPPGCRDARLEGGVLLCVGVEATTAWSLDGATPLGAWPGRAIDVAWHARSARPVLLDEHGALTLGGAPFGPPHPAIFRVTLAGDTLVTRIGLTPRTVPLATGVALDWPAPCRPPERLLALALESGGRLAAACSGGVVLVGEGGVLTPTAARLSDPVAVEWLDGDLLVGTVRGDVLRIGLDGVERWRTSTDGAAFLGVGRLDAGGVWARSPRGTWLLDAATGTLRTRLPARVGAPVLDADGALHAVVEGIGGAPGTLRVWRLPARWPATLLVTTGGLSAVAVSPDSRALAIGGGHRSQVTRWAVDSGAIVSSALPDGVVKALAFAPDGEHVIASISGANALFGLDAAGARISAPVPLLTTWRRLAWLATGARVGLAYGTWPPFAWDAAGAALPLTAQASTYTDLGVGPDGTAAALVDDVGAVYWLGGVPLRVEPRAVLPGARAADLGPDGALAVATEDTLVILDETGAERLRWPLGGRAVVDIACSADGAWIATASIAGTAEVWSAHTGALTAVLSAHTDRVASVEFAPDNTWLATVSWDRTARRWSMAPLRDGDPTPATIEARWGVSLAEALGAMSL
jgi:hypothetical protein